MSRWVYLHRAADGSVLYVGCTDDLRRRTRDHMRVSRWRHLIAKVEADSYIENNNEALRRETALIRKYEPPYNIRSNPAVERESAAWQRLARHCGLLDALDRTAGRTAVEAWDAYCIENSRANLVAS